MSVRASATMSSAVRRNCAMESLLDTASLKLPIFRRSSYSDGLGTDRLHQVNARPLLDGSQHWIIRSPLQRRVDVHVNGTPQFGLNGVEQQRDIWGSREFPRSVPEVRMQISDIDLLRLGICSS